MLASKPTARGHVPGAQSTALAEAVAAELGGDVAVVALYTESLGDTGSGADPVAGMPLTNAERIADALG